MRSFRRLAALLALLAVTAGFTVQGFAAFGIGVAMAAGSMDDGGDCDGCPADDGLAAMACHAICGGPCAVLPDATLLRAPDAVPLDSPAAASPADCATGPAPPPPRPAVLS